MSRKKDIPPVAAVPAPRLLRIAQAAAYLGCTVWFLRGLLWSRRLPYIKLGRRFLVDRADLDTFVEYEKNVGGAPGRVQPRR